MQVKKLIEESSKKHIIIFSASVCIGTLLISALTSWDQNPIGGIDKVIGDGLITLMCLVLIQVIGIGKTAGFNRKGFSQGLILGIPFIIIGIIAAIIGSIGVQFNALGRPQIGTVILFALNMFMVGVNEEITLRSLVLNNMLTYPEDNRRGIMKAVMISTLIFGMIHIPNIFFVPPITLIVQTVNATSAGVLFGAIYIRSRNIWACIVIHTLVDWLALFVGQCFLGGSSVIMINMNILQGIIMIIAGPVPPLIIALFYLRKTKLSL